MIEQSTQTTPVPRSTSLALLQVFVWCEVLIPARLVIKPIGSFGSPASIVGALCFVFWAAGALRPELLARKAPAVRLILLALVVPCVISFAVLHMHSVPGDELNSADRGILFLIVWSGVALLAAEGLADEYEVMRLVRVLVAAAATASSIAIAQSRLGVDASTWGTSIPGLSVAGQLDSVLSRSGLLRPAGTATHPLELGTLLAVMLGPALVLAFHDRRWSAIRRWTGVGLIALGIPVTLTRSAIISATLVIILFLSGSSPAIRIRAGIGVVMVGLVIFLTTPGVIGTINGLFAGATSDTSITTRTSDYPVVLSYFRSSPLVGRGPFTFLPKFRILDNQWLATLVEMGILGVLGLAVFIIGPAFVARSLWHHGHTTIRRQLGNALAAGSLAAAWGALTYDMLGFPLFPGIFALLIGIGGALWTIDRSQDVATTVPAEIAVDR